MTSFTLFRRGDCPICNGAAKGCRQSNLTDLIFCRSRDSQPTNYVYRGEDVHGFGMWANSNQPNEECERRRRKFLEAEKQRRQLQLEKQMLATERDKWYRLLLDELGLTKSDYQKLLDRGFTSEQIANDGYKSVSKWQKLKNNYPLNLPGVLSNGVLNVCGDGILCPISNQDGLIVSCQVRLHEAKDGRYRWLTSATKNNPDGSTSHLNCELPVGVFEPEHFTGNSIWLTEGTSIKPSLACYRLGVPVIGASSGRFNTSPEASKAAIKYLSNKYQTQVLTFAVDAGDVVNRDGVPERWQQQIEFFSSLGYECRIAWWCQIHKDCDDIDELPIEKYQFIEYISIERFIGLCQKYGGIKPSKQAEFKDYNEKVIAVQKKLHTLSYAADIECNPHQKYLPDLRDRIPKSGIVLLKAAKGSGKSHQIKQIKQQWVGGFWEEKIIDEPQQLDILDNPQSPKIERIWHEKTGKKFISINARIALGREQAIRWDFSWIEDTDFEKSQEFYADGEILETATILETIDAIGLCWDSLGKLFDRDWSNTLVVIDELELGLTHISTSSTCRDRRSKILHTIAQKLPECLGNGGMLLAADADLTDISYEFINDIAPGHIPFIVSLDYQRPDEDKWFIEFHSGKKDEILSQIIDHFADENCEPIAVATDNQAEAEALHNLLCKKYPYLKKEIGGAIRIDSKITQTDFGKNFVKRPNESTEEYKPKILIYTPSLGVGCSIDIDYYKKVFGLFFGNLEPSQARQMLARVRKPVDRIVWCKSRAGFAENDHVSFLPDIIKQQIFAYNDTAHELIDTALYLAKEKATGIDNDAELLPHLIEVLQGMMGENGTWNNPHIDLVCKIKARRNYALSQLALQLRQELIEEGHNLIDWEAITQTSAGDSIQDEKEEIKQHRALMVANAQDITVEEAKQIDRKVQKTDEEEYQSTKAHLKEELPGIKLTQNFVYKAVFRDGRRWLNQVKLFWMILNPEATKEADRKHWKYKLKQFYGAVSCIHDVRTFSPKVEAIHKSNLLKIVQLDDFTTEYYDNDERLTQWFSELLKRNRKTNFIKTAFGITITKDTQIIKFINKLLGRIGLRLKKSRQGTDGTNYYTLDPGLVLDPDRIFVLEALTRKYEQQKIDHLDKEQEVLAQREKDAIAIQQLRELEAKSQVATLKVDDEPQPNDIAKWLDDLPHLTECLAICESKEMLEDLRAIAPAEALRQASRHLPADKKCQIRQWVAA